MQKIIDLKKQTNLLIDELKSVCADAGLGNDGNEYKRELDGLGEITVGKGLGFLNAGLRWNIAQNLLIEVNFKDINLDADDFANREIKIMYSEKF